MSQKFTNSQIFGEINLELYLILSSSVIKQADAKPQHKARGQQKIKSETSKIYCSRVRILFP